MGQLFIGLAIIATVLLAAFIMKTRHDRKVASRQLPAWHFADQDCLEDKLDNYDPHLVSLLSEVKELIPREFYRNVFIGGGFAAHIAGITNEHGDIDLFVNDEMVFQQLTDRIVKKKDVTDRRHERDSHGYVVVLKCIYKDLKFDLVDAHEYMHECLAVSLMQTFDINWSMAVVDLHNETVIVHKDALSTTPIVNPNRVEVCPEGTRDRLDKYANRLRREPDRDEVKRLQAIIDARIKYNNGLIPYSDFY